MEVQLKLLSTRCEGAVPPHTSSTVLSHEEENAVLDSALGPATEDSGNGPETIEVVTLADLTYTDEKRLALRYEETDDSGMQGCTVEISFDPREPDLIAVRREGELSMMLVLEVGRMHTSVYRLGSYTLQLQAHALRIENNLTAEGGSFLLEYNLQIGPINSAHIKMTGEVRPLNA